MREQREPIRERVWGLEGDEKRTGKGEKEWKRLGKMDEKWRKSG